MPDAVHNQTPSLAVIDSRGLVVRQVSLHRAVANDPSEIRIESQMYDAAGRLIACRDPRLFALFAVDPTTPANATNIYSLSSTFAAAPHSEIVSREANRMIDHYSSTDLQTRENKRSFDSAEDVRAQELKRSDLLTQAETSLAEARQEMDLNRDCISMELLKKVSWLEAEAKAIPTLRGVDLMTPRRVSQTMELTGPLMWREVPGPQEGSSMFADGQFKTLISPTSPC
jgi:hypothetical protein